jgi:hypothetical protein
MFEMRSFFVKTTVWFVLVINGTRKLPAGNASHAGNLVAKYSVVALAGPMTMLSSRGRLPGVDG